MYICLIPSDTVSQESVTFIMIVVQQALAVSQMVMLMLSCCFETHLAQTVSLG
jgi:hypothetical protein